MRVVDASLLGAIEARCLNANTVLEALSALVEEHDLVFCDEVIREMAWLYEGSGVLMWARAIKGQRVHKGADFLRVEAIAAAIPELVDPTSRDELCAVFVLAQAEELAEVHDDLCVVSEDFGDKPTRMSLADACDQRELCCLTLADFLDEIGLADQLP